MMSRHHCIKGFTLIELLVSLAIGSTVTGAGLSLYLQMSKTRSVLQVELDLQEHSYFAHETLRQYINQAGYRPLQTALANSPLLPVNDMNQSFPEINGRWASGEFIRAVDSGVLFRFEGASDASGVADGSMVDCEGTSIAEGEIAEVLFSLVDGAMLCTSGGAVVTVIGDDEDIQIEQIAVDWGIDTNNDDSVDEYRAADLSIAANETLLAIRVSLLFSSRDEVQNNPVTYSFNGVDYSATDSRLRRESVTTLQIKQ